MDRLGHSDRAGTPPPAITYDDLTKREREVLDHLLDGQMNKQIALDLGISEKTVSTHRVHILAKLGVSSMVELARFFPMQQGDKSEFSD